MNGIRRLVATTLLLSLDGKTCGIIYVSYWNVDLKGGTFSYYSMGEEWSGAYPVANNRLVSKTYDSSVRVSGSVATIKGSSYSKSNKPAW
jgi:hypothetical protein